MIVPCTVTLLLAGCATTSAPTDGIQFRSENWPLAADSGFAVAPSVAVAGVNDPGEAAEAAVLFTNEFYAALLVSLPGASLRSPAQTLGMLDATGGNARARLQSLRRDLYRDTALVPEELASISRDVQHRFLLVGWLDEGVSEETKGGGYEFDSSGRAVRPLTYNLVEGRATAVVLDLWVNEVLWRGAVNYKANRVDGNADTIRKELNRTRVSAAIRLADFVGQQSR